MLNNYYFQTDSKEQALSDTPLPPCKHNGISFMRQLQYSKLHLSEFE